MLPENHNAERLCRPPGELRAASWKLRGNTANSRYLVSVLGVIIALLGLGPLLRAQDNSAPAQMPAEMQVPAAGGPQGDSGPYSVPKKTEEPPPEPAPPAKNPPQIGNYSITKDVQLVTVPVIVANSTGQFIPGLKEGNFRIWEDGVQQKINSFNVAEAPVTAVLLVEFAANNYAFMADMLNTSYAFADSLQPKDWVAVVSYDIKTHILTDFTQDKRQVVAALNQLRIPGFRETNLFDALHDTIDRLHGIKGRKYIILVSTGMDTFSKFNYGRIQQEIKETKDISIFAIGTGQAFRLWLESHGWLGGLAGGPQILDFLQADNQMNTFAKLTGGRAYFPRFPGELPEIFRQVAASIRNQYVLSYYPTNAQLDGTYRKLRVELVDAEKGGPLKIVDQKGKKTRYNLIAREGYTAQHRVE